MAFGAALLTTLSGCQKPVPPQITPKEVRVVALGPQGLEVLLKVEATNPNKLTLSVQSISAQAKLDNRWDMGAVAIAKPIVLPSNTPTMIDVPLTMPWSDVTALRTLASNPNPIPFAVEGFAKVGGERLNVDLPFAISGTITREQMVNAAMKGLPAIPGLKFP